MSEISIEKERLWERGWEGHEKAQRLRLSRIPFREKLEWLEETQEIIQQFEQQKDFPFHSDS